MRTPDWKLKCVASLLVLVGLALHLVDSPAPRPQLSEGHEEHENPTPPKTAGPSRARSVSQDPGSSGSDPQGFVIRTVDHEGHPIGHVPVVFGLPADRGHFDPIPLGRTSNRGVLRFALDHRFEEFSRIQLEPDVLSPDVRAVVVDRTAIPTTPIDLVVPPHAAIEVQVLGPDGRPWPSTWSVGRLTANDRSRSSRAPQRSRCDADGVCRFLVAADGRGYRFRFLPDARRKLGLGAEYDPNHTDPNRPSIHAPSIVNTTTRTTDRIDGKLRLVTGQLEAWQPDDRGRRLELHTLEETGEYLFSVLRPFADGSFATLIARDRGRTLFVLKEPTSPSATIAEPEQPGIDEVSRQDLGRLDFHSPPLLWTGQFLLGGLEPRAATFRIESSDEGAFWSAVRSASVHLLPDNRFEVRGLLPDLAHFRIRWTEVGMKEPLWLTLHEAQPEVVWDLRHRATARVLIRGHDRRKGPLRVRLFNPRTNDVLEGSGYVDTETDLLAFRFRGLAAGSYFVLIGRETRAAHPSRSLQIPPDTNDAYFVSIDR